MLSAYGKTDYYNVPPWKNTTSSEFDISNVTTLPRVDIVFADDDMSPDLIDASVNAGAKGIVIAGVGNGNMNKASVDAAARAAKKGVVVVRSSRVMSGLVGRNVEINDDEFGFVASDELNPQKVAHPAHAGAPEASPASQRFKNSSTPTDRIMAHRGIKDHEGAAVAIDDVRCLAVHACWLACTGVQLKRPSNPTSEETQNPTKAPPPMLRPDSGSATQSPSAKPGSPTQYREHRRGSRAYAAAGPCALE